MMKKTFVLLLSLVISCVLFAQENICFSSRLKTLQVRVNDKWGEPPLMLLGGSNWVVITFDDLQPNYQRYSYTITHCNADWQPSDLLESEYMTGFNDTHIEDYEPAIGTEMDYCHYSFTLPNEDNSLLVSGNYRINIYEDGEDDPVAQACFSVIEPKVGIDIALSSNTDIDTYSTHQQLSFSVNYSGYHVANPINEFKYIVQQNHRWDTHAENLRPTYMRVNQVVFEHNPSLIFNAGNEYRRFEILDEYMPTMNVDRMYFDEPYYHALLYVDKQRINYLYDEDQNGRFWVRNDDNINNDTESDYFITHFALKMPELPNGDLYLFSDFTGSRIDEQYKMEYNAIEHQYELATPLKQGSYNYMYMFVRDGENTALTAPAEGDFHQTENEYYVYVFHRPFGQRYDKLVGFKKANFKE